MIYFNVSAENAFVNKAAAQGSAKELPEALMTLKAAEQRYPGKVKVYTNEAITYLKLGMRSEAPGQALQARPWLSGLTHVQLEQAEEGPALKRALRRAQSSSPPLVFLACWAAYAHTLNPAFRADDSPETIAASVTLGIQHPPAYPLYTLMGRLFSFIPLGAPAFRLNFMAAFFGALACAALERLEPAGLAARGPSPRFPWPAPLRPWRALSWVAPRLFGRRAWRPRAASTL